MVLSSAAASTQTTILPTARTTLSMAVFKAIPDAFGKIHRRYLTPTVSTLTMGGISIVLYVVMNYVSNGNSVIEDSVSALGVWIAFYYGLTGFSSFWYYRKTLRESARTLWMRGILPLLGGLILWFAMFWSFWYYWNPVNSYTPLHLPRHPPGHRRRLRPRRGHGDPRRGADVRLDGIPPGLLPGRDPQPRHPDPGAGGLGVPVGLFGIEPFDEAGAERQAGADAKEPTQPSPPKRSPGGLASRDAAAGRSTAFH